MLFIPDRCGVVQWGSQVIVDVVDALRVARRQVFQDAAVAEAGCLREGSNYNQSTYIYPLLGEGRIDLFFRPSHPLSTSYGEDDFDKSYKDYRVIAERIRKLLSVCFVFVVNVQTQIVPFATRTSCANNTIIKMHLAQIVTFSECTFCKSYLRNLRILLLFYRVQVDLCLNVCSLNRTRTRKRKYNRYHRFTNCTMHYHEHTLCMTVMLCESRHDNATAGTGSPACLISSSRLFAITALWISRIVFCNVRRETG